MISWPSLIARVGHLPGAAIYNEEWPAQLFPKPKR